MTTARPLTLKQQRFVEEFPIDLNATQAAIRAGYSKKTAESIGLQLLRKTPVRDAIAAAKAARSQRTQIDADLVLRRLLEIATVDVNELVELRREACGECWPEAPDPKPRAPNPACTTCRGEGFERPFFKDTRNLSPAARSLYAGVKVTKDGLEMKLNSQDKALELLGKHLGLFVERQEVTGKNGEPLQAAVTIYMPSNGR